jgi:ketosteroid isomerase-like protein
MIRVAMALVILVGVGMAQTKAKAEETLEQRLAGFVSAFDDLDWARFQTFFAEDATVFHPAAPNVKRTEGRAGFEQAWLGVFERIRKNSGKTSAPYMDLKPKDVRIQYLADDVALVTFHLEDGTVLGRRTMVWKREGQVWRIVHVHASNLEAN